MKLVTISDLCVEYDGYEALQHVNLEIDDADFLGIIGPNGGGKTTLVKAILGTVPYSGSVKLAPELFRGRERLIGYMPQISKFDPAFPISVFEVVLSGLQGHTASGPPTTGRTGNGPGNSSMSPESQTSQTVRSVKYPVDRCNALSSQGPLSPNPNS